MGEKRSIGRESSVRAGLDFKIASLEISQDIAIEIIYSLYGSTRGKDKSFTFDMASLIQ